MDERQQQTTAAGPNAALKEAPPKDGEGVDLNHPASAHPVIIDRANALVRTTPVRRKIAVCGFASSSRGLIPADDPEWEIWGLNQLYRHIQRADRWFDIHANWNEELVPGTDHEAWLRDSGLPVYMGAEVESIPNSIRYPLEGIIDRQGADYFTSSISYMVALAIDEIDRMVAERLREPASEKAIDALADTTGNYALAACAVSRQLYGEHTIGLFGIDLIVGEEYDWQKACAEFWIGQATGRGISVNLPATTALCKQLYRYGYEREPASPILLSEFTRAKKELIDERERLKRLLFMHDGGVQRDEFWENLLTLRLRGLARQPF